MFQVGGQCVHGFATARHQHQMLVFRGKEVGQFLADAAGSAGDDSRELGHGEFPQVLLWGKRDPTVIQGGHAVNRCRVGPDTEKYLPSAGAAPILTFNRDR